MRIDGTGPFSLNHLSSEFINLGVSLPLQIGYYLHYLLIKIRIRVIQTNMATCGLPCDIPPIGLFNGGVVVEKKKKEKTIVLFRYSL